MNREGVDRQKLHLHIHMGSGRTRDHHGMQCFHGAHGTQWARWARMPAVHLRSQVARITDKGLHLDTRVNGTARARSNGRWQRDVFVFMMALQ